MLEEEKKGEEGGEDGSEEGSEEGSDEVIDEGCEENGRKPWCFALVTERVTVMRSSAKPLG